jgi:tetratricopeptide (TPR) repeat protein
MAYRKVAAPRPGVFQNATHTPSAHALGYVDAAAPRLSRFDFHSSFDHRIRNAFHLRVTKNVQTPEPRSGDISDRRFATRALAFGALAALMTIGNAFAQSRVASDFELRQMEALASRATDYLSQLSAHLNLGDVRASRGESALSRAEYERALSLSERERIAARRDSTLGRYTIATAYAGLAQAKLGRADAAFDDLEEAIRYGSDSGRIWNLYSTSMALLGLPRKAVASARNAVEIARGALAAADSASHRLDLAVYQYALASALLDGKNPAALEEAAGMLRSVIDALQSSQFRSLRNDIARAEAFEIYSTARGDTSSYIALLNRSHLKLGRIDEDGGDLDAARREYAAVLSARNDDPTALAAMARLSAVSEDRQRYFAEAFDANPFSVELIRSYEQFIAGRALPPPAEQSTGARVRQFLQQMSNRQLRDASATLDGLGRGGGNEVLAYLAARLAIERGDIAGARTEAAGIGRPDLRGDLDRRLDTAIVRPPSFLAAATLEGHSSAETGGESLVRDPSAEDLLSLVRLFATSSMLPSQREALDRLRFSSDAAMAPAVDGSDPSMTSFESGSVAGIPFRFQSPTPFRGVFQAARPLRLTYRILGVTTDNRGLDQLLVEPLRLEASP